jgi:hypothetical protein
MNNDEMKAEFLSFAIEAYKTKLGVSGAKVAEYFEETGTLDFLLENYDLLHTPAGSWIMNFYLCSRNRA